MAAEEPFQRYGRILSGNRQNERPLAAGGFDRGEVFSMQSVGSCSAYRRPLERGGSPLTSDRVEHVSIANPDHAPTAARLSQLSERWGFTTP